jgi:cell division protein FtsB
MRHSLTNVIKYFQIALLFVSISSLGILMGEKTLAQKGILNEKKAKLKTENRNLESEIKALERRLALMRSDQKVIEKIAKRKLGMVAPNETIYVFDKNGTGSRGRDPGECGLEKVSKMP